MIKLKDLLTEGKQMTFMKFLDGLEATIISGHKAMKATPRGDIDRDTSTLHSLMLMLRYVQSMQKKYKKDKTKLTFKG